MRRRPQEPRGTAPARAYRLLLRAYPADFRAAYGSEIELALRDLRREPRAHGVRFWAAMIWDVARSAPGLRAEALRARWVGDIHLPEGSVRTLAILTMLVGALQALGAIAEGWPGGPYPLGGAHLVSIALMAIAGALLLGAGIALLRRTSRAAALARGAAIACLATTAVVRLLHPWMSIFSLLLAIGFPIALLLLLRIRRGGGPSAPARA